MRPLTFLLLSALCHCAAAHDWDQRVLPGKTKVVLSCPDPELKPFVFLNNESYWSLFEITWLLPGEMNNDPDVTRTFKAPYALSDDKLNLTVSVVNETTSGVYHCAAKYNNTWFFIKRGINFGGQPFSDILTEYTPNLIRGGVAAASYLFLWILLSLVYKFRYKAERSTAWSDTPRHGNVNPAMMPDDNAVTTSL